MIGMMNSGSDSVEFYGAARQSSLYAEKKPKVSRTYTPEGRVFINGAPVFQESPEDMWQGIIQKLLTKRFIVNAEAKPATGPLSALRRLSSRLRVGQQKEQSPVVRLPRVDDSNNDGHVTVIRINSLDNSRVLKCHPPPRPPNAVSALENSSILMRLLEERANQKDSDDNEIKASKEVSSDSGRASIDEDLTNISTEVVVHRF